MTGDGMCGAFIPDRVLAGWWRSHLKASDRKWAGRCITGCGRGRCECGWDHLSLRYLYYIITLSILLGSVSKGPL